MKPVLRAVTVLIVLTLAWGALSFGAVYPWGYWPLLAVSAAAGLVALLLPTRPSISLGRVAAVLSLAAVVTAVQLIPVSAATIAAANPARDAFLRRYDVLYATTPTSHALSINPATTTIALACFAAFSLLLLGTARLTSDRDAMRLLTGGIAGFGLLLALFALAQNLALSNQTGEGHTVLIYGFWPDPYVNKPFGPYINKNNYAGWMLMALPLTLGVFAANLDRLWRSAGADWTARFLALSSSDGARALLTGLCALVMAVSIVVSMSRSGMIALAAIIVGLAWFAPVEKPKRTVRLGIALMTLVIVAAWAGAETIRSRFEDRSDASMRGRLIAWKNAARIAVTFPVIGTGFNTFATAMIIDQQGDPDNFWEEAHNDYLQVAAEGGSVGSAVCVLAVVVIALEIRRRFLDVSPSRTSLWIRVGAVAGICAIGLQELVEFSLQIPGNAALFVVLTGIALHRSPRPLQARG
jgi:O-antigen ligase